MAKPENLSVGDHVRIAPDYYEPALQNRCGKIIALPDKEHLGKYLVEIKGRPLVKEWIPNA